MLQEHQIIIARNVDGDFVDNPPLANGDYQISLNGLPFRPVDNPPTFIPDSPVIELMLSETERAASRAVIRGVDQSGQKVWADNFTKADVPTDNTELLQLVRQLTAELARVKKVNEPIKHTLIASVENVSNTTVETRMDQAESETQV